MEMQNTIGKSVSVSGIALHTGVRVNMRMLPAPENTGIVFRRMDMEGTPEVKAHALNVIDVRRATTIAAPSKAFVVLVEHIMASLHAAKVDNIYIEMDSAEPPICDGSALPFFRMLMEAGIVPQSAPAKTYAVESPLYIEKNGTTVVALPPEKEGELKITCTVSYAGTLIGTQFLDFVLTPENFEKELGPCRTFAEYKDLATLFQMGLAKGGSLDNAVVIHDGAIISHDGMRFPNELVRHKVMDMVGDLYLTGVRLSAHIVAVKPGHPTNVALSQAIVGKMRGQQ
ncbi:MAG: UDP-3-O-[3-hydroxymyristoyl] N-acetylglucosamine deacetylase [Lentisphaeria bacterium]|nr:UDP-3-O-[3-hydroxymyristoyl] N-acetylglucosamine deacetylase [Lentisphaeria bacterium]